jgi:hypothetical protein
MALAVVPLLRATLQALAALFSADDQKWLEGWVRLKKEPSI